MAPGNEFCPYLSAPYVNHDLMTQPRFLNRLVRVPCTLDTVHDVTTAIVMTFDGWELNVNLTTAFKRKADGTFSPVVFPPGKKYYVLEGIVKNDGWWLMLMKQPEVIGKCNMGFVNNIIDFACDEDWLDSLGRVPADPRLELGYNGAKKPDILKLLTYDSPPADENTATTKKNPTEKERITDYDSISVTDMSSPAHESITDDESASNVNGAADGDAANVGNSALDSLL